MLGQQAPVYDLVRERVVKGVLDLWKQARFVQELAGLQVRQSRSKLLTGHIHDARKQIVWDIHPDHGGGLKKKLVLRRQTVQARSKYGLYRVRDSDCGQLSRQRIGAPASLQYFGFDQRSHYLFQKERITAGVLDQHVLDRNELRRIAQHR